MSELVKSTAIDQATIRGIIERLKTRKLMRLTHDPADRRKVLVSVTAAGQALIHETVPFALKISEQTFGELNAAERVAFIYLLRKMINFDESEANTALPKGGTT